MKTEEEMREKQKEAWSRYDSETYAPDKEYFETVAAVIDWILGEGDDPLMDF